MNERHAVLLNEQIQLDERKHLLASFCAQHPVLGQRIQNALFVNIDGDKVTFYDTVSARRYKRFTILTTVDRITGKFVEYIKLPPKIDRYAMVLAAQGSCFYTVRPEEALFLQRVFGIADQTKVPVRCTECTSAEPTQFSFLDEDYDPRFYCPNCGTSFWVSAGSVAAMFGAPAPKLVLFCNMCDEDTYHSSTGQTCTRHTARVYQCMSCNELREE